LRQQSPARGWHIQSPNGLLIARNYPNWSKDRWSAKWGRWFRFDPTTGVYFYYEPALGCYVEVEYITAYSQPLETPISEPTTNPDEIPEDDVPAPEDP
jgi:hypothetical protein